MKKIILLGILFILTGCAGSVAASTPTPQLFEVKYVFVSNENFCMGRITIQKSAEQREEYILFPNGSAAEISTAMSEGQQAFMQADYMTSSKDLPCEIICRFYLEGELWQEARASGTKGTQVVCQGIIGQK